jgi:predicted amidophosphoribosyltransferase
VTDLEDDDVDIWDDADDGWIEAGDGYCRTCWQHIRVYVDTASCPHCGRKIESFYADIINPAEWRALWTERWRLAVADGLIRRA